MARRQFQIRPYVYSVDGTCLHVACGMFLDALAPPPSSPPGPPPQVPTHTLLRGGLAVVADSQVACTDVETILARSARWAWCNVTVTCV